MQAVNPPTSHRLKDAALYRVIQDRSLSWGVDSVGHLEREKKSHVHVSDSEWIPRQSCLNIRFESDIRKCMEMDGGIF
jgi:hypothetical protein